MLVMKTRLIAMLAVVVLALTGCPVPSSPSNTKPSSSNATTILSHLGVAEVSTPPAATVTDTGGTKVTVDPSSWQPLKKDHTVFSPRAELLLLGAQIDSNWSAYYKDGAAAYALSSNPASGTDQAWLQVSAKTSVAADIDGDGIAEGLVFYALSSTDTNLYFRVFKQGVLSGQGTVSGISLSGQSFNRYAAPSRVGMGTIWFPYLNCARADLNGDGHDEVLVVDYNKVYVVTVSAAGSSYLASAGAPKQFNHPVSAIAAGDINGDHKDDIVVGEQSGLYAIYSAGFDTPLTTPEEVQLTGVSTCVEAALGDFDGNGALQLALVGPNASGIGQISMFDFDPANFKLANAVKTFLTPTGNPCQNNNGSDDYYRLLPRAADFTGGVKDQLVVLSRVFADPMNGTSTNDIDFSGSIDQTQNTVVNTLVSGSAIFSYG